MRRISIAFTPICRCWSTCAALNLTLDVRETALLEAAFDRTIEPVQW
ncbi:MULTISPECIES: hypothetical protein [unclassified Burkholderia]|nr:MULTISPECIES: hypothetical protein [unclassified Burkholderia]